jgi:hypothetical protein
MKSFGTFWVSPNLLIEAFSRFTVQLRKVLIDHHLVPTYQINSALNDLTQDGANPGCEVLLRGHREKSSGRLGEVEQPTHTRDGMTRAYKFFFT